MCLDCQSVRYWRGDWRLVDSGKRGLGGAAVLTDPAINRGYFGVIPKVVCKIFARLFGAISAVIPRHFRGYSMAFTVAFTTVVFVGFYGFAPGIPWGLWPTAVTAVPSGLQDWVETGVVTGFVTGFVRGL